MAGLAEIVPDLDAGKFRNAVRLSFEETFNIQWSLDALSKEELSLARDLRKRSISPGNGISEGSRPPHAFWEWEILCAHSRSRTLSGKRIGTSEAFASFLSDFCSTIGKKIRAKDLPFPS